MEYQICEVDYYLKHFKLVYVYLFSNKILVTCLQQLQNMCPNLVQSVRTQCRVSELSAECPNLGQSVRTQGMLPYISGAFHIYAIGLCVSTSSITFKLLFCLSFFLFFLYLVNLFVPHSISLSFLHFVPLPFCLSLFFLVSVSLNKVII